MIMEVAIVWLLCAAIFLELADRAPVIDEPGFGIEPGVRSVTGDSQSENVTAEALSLKTAVRDRASS
ncbi:hypothetical protein AB4Z10_19875 [Bosea sp. RAF48]|uniref:hypothetical protein n=1 Tax=Bosea sp. RAF48 TaxID=3237480 RepID=UPI003F91CF88